MQITFDDLRVLYRLLHLQQETIHHLQQEQRRLQRLLSQHETPTNGSQANTPVLTDERSTHMMWLANLIRSGRSLAPSWARGGVGNLLLFVCGPEALCEA